MEFYLNGGKREYLGDLELTLLKYLREVEGITSTKDGCSGQGVCGACTVLINDKAKLACTTKMKKLEGRSVTTVEGFDLKVQQAFSKAFVEKGGIQCGFCIPGIVTAARGLLIKNLKPTVDEIKRAIQGNLCRCTGYKKIIDSILYTAEILRDDLILKKKDHSGKVGTRLPKYDAYDTVIGKREFVCDISLDGMLHGALKFSDYPRAKILSIDISKAQAYAGVVKVLIASDIPGERIVGLIVKDWPMMVCEGEITRYIGDVLAQVVAVTEDIAREAASLIEVKYKVLNPIVTVDQAKKNNAPKIHPEGNLLSKTKILRGDFIQARKLTAFVSKGTYFTQRIEHGFLETECAVAETTNREEERGVKLYSQGQGVYEDRKEIAKILNLPQDMVHVIQVQNGGGFGGKEDLTVQGHACLAAYLTGFPVRVFLTRDESMKMHPKRHPLRMKYEVGCNRKGMLTYLKADIDGDTGAYASVGMKVLERAAGHATSAYSVSCVDLTAQAYYTNNVPCGAMRGFGVNQTAFAMENCVEDLCTQGGFDRFKFRLDNCLKEGSMTASGQVLKGGIGVEKCLLALKDNFYKHKYAGIAVGIKNTGIGNGMTDEANCKIEIEEDGRVIIYHGWTEMGQGVHTMAIQTVCQETGISPDVIEVRVDTNSETVCGMTTSSRGTSLVGNSLIDACKKIKEDLLDSSLEQLAGKKYLGNWKCEFTTDLNDTTIKNQVTHFSYSYAAQLVTLNKFGKIDKVYAAHDAGRIMNPTLFEGQIEGSVHMGLGYALSEKFEMNNGYPVHTNLGKIGIIRAKDTPDVEVIGVEAHDLYGPYGAKGVGEVGLVPTAGAVACALFQYDGVRRYSLPIGVTKKR